MILWAFYGVYTLHLYYLALVFCYKKLPSKVAHVHFIFLEF